MLKANGDDCKHREVRFPIAPWFPGTVAPGWRWLAPWVLLHGVGRVGRPRAAAQGLRHGPGHRRAPASAAHQQAAMTLRTPCHLPEPQFPHLQSGSSHAASSSTVRCVASGSCCVRPPACWQASAWRSVTVSCSSFVSLGLGGNRPRSPGGCETFPARVPAAAHQADGVKSQAGAGSQTTGQPSTRPGECGAEGGWPRPLGSPARWEQSPAGPFFWFSRDSEIPARGR